MVAQRAGLWELARIFGRIGCLSWGGGAATLAMMHDEFCTRRSLLTEEEFQLLFSLSRLTPGMNLLSLTVLLGHRTHGLAGAVAALAALTVPSFTFIVLGCLLLQRGAMNPYVTGAIRGLGPAAAALLLHTGLQLGRGSLRKEGSLGRALWLGVVAVATLLTALNWLQPVWVVLLGGGAGILLARWTSAAPVREVEP